jgi:hypothetical protein
MKTLNHEWTRMDANGAQAGSLPLRIAVLFCAVFLMHGCAPCHAQDAPPPAPMAIDFSKFTDADRDALMRGAMKATHDAEERLAAQQKESAADKAQLDALTQDLGNARIENAKLTNTTIPALDGKIKDMRDWGIQQQQRADAAEKKDEEDRAKLRTLLWIVGVLVTFVAAKFTLKLPIPWQPVLGYAIAAAIGAGVAALFIAAL